MVSTDSRVDATLDRSGKIEQDVRRVDAAGRRWFTWEFKGALVAQCVQPGASVSKIAVDHGLNPNLVRKWIERAHEVDAVRVAARFIRAEPLPAREPAGALYTGESIQIRIGVAVISIGDAGQSGAGARHRYTSGEGLIGSGPERHGQHRCAEPLEASAPIRLRSAWKSVDIFQRHFWRRSAKRKFDKVRHRETTRCLARERRFPVAVLPKE